MAASLPVVATHVGGLPEAVVAGETGVLVGPGAPEALAEAVRGLLDAPERAARLGAAGRARVLERFSIASMCKAYEQLYAEIVERH
jgi:glycosyltransferase involved in cell wall biosynthesis